MMFRVCSSKRATVLLHELDDADVTPKASMPTKPVCLGGRATMDICAAEGVEMPIRGFIGGLNRFDKKLSILMAVLLLALAVADYVSSHDNVVWGSVVGGLSLLLAGGGLALIAVVRIAVSIFFPISGQRRQNPAALLACIALLAAYPLVGKAAVFYSIDQFRFHLNKSFYVAEVEKSDTRPKLVSFDWGQNGFQSANTYYLLVFDQSNAAAERSKSLTGLPIPNKSDQCSTSALPLSGSFYSVTVHCPP
jgi:hypothetical protein